MLKISTFNKNQLLIDPKSALNIYTVIDDVDTIENPNSIFNPRQITQISPSIKIYPVLYTLGKATDVQDMAMTNLRIIPVYAIFHQWTNLGYNTRHAKSPFSSKAFQKYLDDIVYTSADYIITKF